MNTQKKIFFTWFQLRLSNRVLSFVLSLSILGAGLFGWQPQASAILAQGDAVTDPQAILRYSLPIENDSVRKLQKNLEDISNQLRGKRWKNIGRDLTEANFVLSARRDRLLATIPDERKPEAESLIAQLVDGTTELKEIVETKDREATYLKRFGL